MRTALRAVRTILVATSTCLDEVEYAVRQRPYYATIHRANVLLREVIHLTAEALDAMVDDGFNG